jgi:RNA polymerase sigma factor (sigma-70 family)
MRDDRSEDDERRRDATLLADGSADAFADFYRRHFDVVLGYCARKGLDADEAADVVAETFAAAWVARTGYRPRRGRAEAWLLGIAGHKLADRARRWNRDRSTQQRLELERVRLTADDYRDYAEVRDAVGRAGEALDELPHEQRAAVHGRVIDETDYSTLARRHGVSEATARQRVSRGLAALRARLTEER